MEANASLKSRPINQSFYKNLADIEAATTNESLQMLIDYHVLRNPIPISLIAPLSEKPTSPSAMTSDIVAQPPVHELRQMQLQEHEQQGEDVSTSRTIFRMLPAFASEKGRVTPTISPPTMDNNNDGNGDFPMDFPELLNY
jgi:hypothetical protein